MASKKDDASSIASMVAEEYLKERAAAANQQAFVAVMQKVPNSTPSDADKLP
jgi:hypothetical protein